MQHGGLLSYTNEKNLIDFSSNINPLGPPRGLKTFLNKSFNKVLLYPDINYKRLKKTIAQYLDAPYESIILGNGAVEIIDNFCALFKNIIVCTPSFSEYTFRAKIRNKACKTIPYQNDFTLNLNLISKAITQNTLVILGNPNNPTGLRIKKEKLLELYDIIKLKNAFLLLDEAFFEFCPKDYDSICLFKKDNFANVCIIRAATKFFALPAIRLGYACTSVKIAAEIEKLSIAWHINGFAEAAAFYILNNTSYIQKSKKLIEKERFFLFTELERVGKKGKLKLKPYPSDCNFILSLLTSESDKTALRILEKKGILIRPCSSFETLGNNHIRIAVKGHADNLKLIKALENI